MRRQEIVDEGQRRLQAERQGLVTGRAHQRVHPDQPVARSLQPGDGMSHLRRIPPVPPIADDGDGRAVAQHAARVAAVERLDRLADARPARPVVDRRRHPVERRVDVVTAQQTGDAGQARGEDKRLNASAGVLERVGEIQQQPRVALHRPADVAEQDQRPRPESRTFPAEDE